MSDSFRKSRIFSRFCQVLLSAIACAATSLAGTAAAQSLHTQPIGTVVRDVAELGERQIPLPAGEWVLAAQQVYRSGSSGTVPIAAVYLAQVEGGTVTRDVFALASLEPNSGGWVRDRTVCDRTDSLFNSSDRGDDPRHAACWDMTAIGIGLGPNALQVHRDYASFTEDKHRPKTEITNQFFVAAGGSFLHLVYGWNPEAAGFQPPPAGRRNPWQPDAIAADEARAAYVEKVRAEGERLFPLVLQGFERGLR